MSASAAAPPLPVDRVVAHALGTRIDAVPVDVRAYARDLLLDTLAVGVAGRVTEESRMALRAASAWGSGAEATVWAGGPSLPAGSAAFVNAHQVHTLEWDAINEGAVVHPLTVVVPTVLAYAAREQRAGRHLTGADLLASVVVGVDVAAGLGRASTSPIRFFRPAVCGAMGAVAALVSLDRSEPGMARSALGIAYGAVSGTMQPHTEGSHVLAAQCGLNARSALHSFDLARAGFIGPEHVFDGRYGWFTLIESEGDLDGFLDSLGQRWEVASTSVKPFPSGRATHGGLDMVLALQREYGFKADEVDSITVAVPPLVFDLVGRPATLGMTIGAARLCLSYLVPNALRDGTVGLDTYSLERLRDPELMAAATRVRVVENDNPDRNAFNPQSAEVVLRDGRTFTMTRDVVLGSPERPLTTDALHAKVRTAMIAGGRAEQVDRLTELVGGIESLDDLAPLLEVL